METGKVIAERRKALQLTQAELAEEIGVSPQAVSRWESGKNLPDLDKLPDIAEALKVSVRRLLGDRHVPEHLWSVRDKMFSEKNMFTRLKTTAEERGQEQTYRALYYIREKHAGQNRKPLKYSAARIPYIIHPLMMACHAQSLGIMDDEVLSTILLHDVCEDCGVEPAELPFSGTVREAVDLLTKKNMPGVPKNERNRLYYEAIGRNKIASIAKVIDRCNNVSTMALSFTDLKISSYIDETEEFILPLLDTIKKKYPEYNNAVFLIKYQLLSVLESLKAMMIGE